MCSKFKIQPLRLRLFKIENFYFYIPRYFNLKYNWFLILTKKQQQADVLKCYLKKYSKKIIKINNINTLLVNKKKELKMYSYTKFLNFQLYINLNKNLRINFYYTNFFCNFFVSSMKKKLNKDLFLILKYFFINFKTNIKIINYPWFFHSKAIFYWIKFMLIKKILLAIILKVLSKQFIYILGRKKKNGNFYIINKNFSGYSYYKFYGFSFQFKGIFEKKKRGSFLVDNFKIKNNIINNYKNFKPNFNRFLNLIKYFNYTFLNKKGSYNLKIWLFFEKSWK